jgi:dipeptidyl aminopeptidase/acylaminoacyl peptidase
MASKERRDTHVTLNFGPQWTDTGSGNAWYATNKLSQDSLTRMFGADPESLAQHLDSIKLHTVEHATNEPGTVTGLSMLVEDSNGEHHDIAPDHRVYFNDADGSTNAHHVAVMANGHARADQEFHVNLSEKAGDQAMVQKLRDLGALKGREAILAGVERIDGENKKGNAITNYSVPKEGPIYNVVSKIHAKGSKGTLSQDYSEQLSKEQPLVLSEKDFTTVSEDLIKAHAEHVDGKPMSAMNGLVTTMVVHSKEKPDGPASAHLTMTTVGNTPNPLLRSPPDSAVAEVVAKQTGMHGMETVKSITPLGVDEN